MNAHLNHILAQQRIADLQRAADHARLATNAGTRRRDSRDSYPVVHALPMPTAHPSPEAWPAAGLAAATSPAAARPRDHPPVCRTSSEHRLSRGARMRAARVSLPGDQESTAQLAAPGNDCVPVLISGHGMS
jgi:hypothetical protein